VLLDAALLARRGYTVRVVGDALVRAARGETHRDIADQLDAPPGAPCAAGSAVPAVTSHQLWTLGVRALAALDQHALPTQDRADPLTAALDVLGAAAHAARRRFGPAAGEPWPAITVLTRGRFLAAAPTG
jgi:hypothetical protein